MRLLILCLFLLFCVVVVFGKDENLPVLSESKEEKTVTTEKKTEENVEEKRTLEKRNSPIPRKIKRPTIKRIKPIYTRKGEPFKVKKAGTQLLIGDVITVKVDNTESLEINKLVYVRGVGYFRITTSNKNELYLKLESRGHTDQDDLKVEDSLIVVNERAKQEIRSKENYKNNKHGASRGKRTRKGEKGEPGDDGAPGEKGRQGRHGPKGHKGEVGPQGPEGVGPQGDQGVAGPHGPRGHKGEVGPAGAIGLQGVAGLPGPQGIKGEPFTLTTSVETFSYFLPTVSTNHGKHPDFTYYFSDNSDNSMSKFSNLYVKVGSNPVSPPKNNKNLNELKVKSYTKTCEKNQVLVDGSCNWNLFKYIKKPSWCRAKDFHPGKHGCNNCVIRVDKTKKRYFDGERDVSVVRRITYNRNGYIESVPLNGSSCKIVHLFELTDQEVARCGFFCFFHDIETIHLSDNAITCRYIPPQVIALSLNNNLPVNATKNFENYVSVVTVTVSCQNL